MSSRKNPTFRPVSRAEQKKMDEMESIDCQAEGFDVTSPTFFADVQAVHPDMMVTMKASMLNDPVIGPFLGELLALGAASYHDSDGTAWRMTPERTRPVLERAAKK
jgi:hypothetical protein